MTWRISVEKLLGHPAHHHCLLGEFCLPRNVAFRQKQIWLVTLDEVCVLSIKGRASGLRTPQKRKKEEAKQYFSFLLSILQGHYLKKKNHFWRKNPKKERKKIVKKIIIFVFFGEFPTMSGSIKNFLGHDIDLKLKSHKFMQKYA